MYEDKYQTILAESATGVSVTKLCQTYGVSQNGYYVWKRKQNGTPSERVEEASGDKPKDTNTASLPVPEALPHKMRVIVMISLREVCNLIINKQETFPVLVTDLMRRMTPEERKRVAIELGSIQFEHLIKNDASNQI